MYILPPSISKKIEGYRWQSFTPPAAGKSRRFRGLICHRRSQTTCIFGGVGFLSEGKGSPEIAVGENIYDTLIDLRDCSTERALKDYAEFFEGVKLVPAGYNRD